MSERCVPCEKGRRDGSPCDAAACICRCHREGKSVVDALFDSSLDKARAARDPLQRLSSLIVKRVYVDESPDDEIHVEFKDCGI